MIRMMIFKEGKVEEVTEVESSRVVAKHLSRVPDLGHRGFTTLFIPVDMDERLEA